jgi:PTS system ascorbate-specific IIA component
MSLVRLGLVASDYSQAIVQAGRPLVEHGFVHEDYLESMVRVVDELGPYIVLVEGFALAHAEPGEQVFRNGISVGVLNREVDFGGGKMVKVVFALAATDHDAHISTLGSLAELLADEDSRNLLLNAGDTAQIENLLSGVLGE